MAKIRESNPKNRSGSYDRLFGNEKLGELISKVQSASIRAGNELEKLIKERIDVVDDLDEFLQMDAIPEGIFLVTKSVIKKSQLHINGSEPDFIIFKQQHCYIVELKDGHVFDTKKVDGERASLYGFAERNAQKLRDNISVYFCAFNQKDHHVIWDGFKRMIEFEEIMTGREFCELLEIDYDEIVEIRSRDTEDNTRYFLEELLRIPEIERTIIDIIGC